MSQGSNAIYPSLRDVPVLVSGGANGIGEAIVRAFANQGSKVGFLDIAASQGRALAEELSAQGQSVAFVPCDITDIGALRQSIERIEAHQGATGVLVNCAANDDRHDWTQVSEAYWDERIAVNLRHMFFTIQAVAPGMTAAGRGSIINFGSIGWMTGAAGYTAYATCKAAVHGLTRSFARDLGKSGVRVNTVVPGWVMTERQLALWVDEEAERAIDRQQCLAGRIQPHHVASIVLFLASEDSAMCSAQDFFVDAGWA